MSTFQEQLHPSWRLVLSEQLAKLDAIEELVSKSEYLPQRDLVMRAFSRDMDEIKVVIFGQDPYPDPNYPVGLAFSVDPKLVKLPQSLKNIFRELKDDLGLAVPDSGDLKPWCEQGVLLLNRVLTINPSDKTSHEKLGWIDFTDYVAKILGEREVVAILWGSKAQELQKYFKDSITSPHPSPLSAHRGFFGSKPFSRTNELLRLRGQLPINWELK